MPKDAAGPEDAAALDWRGKAVPVSTRFGDPYYSLDDGLAEARHVFLAGNDLPARFRSGFHIAELGFGTGLNCLAALAAWPGPGALRVTSFEACPISAEAMERALAAFPELTPLARDLVAAWRRGARRLRTQMLQLDVIEGDARATVPRWHGCADAWFLDGFAPARNPELWEPALLVELAGHTAPGGTAATYTAAGAVRRGLAAAGFAVARRPGFGAKRHMTAARLPEAGVIRPRSAAPARPGSRPTAAGRVPTRPDGAAAAPSGAEPVCRVRAERDPGPSQTGPRRAGPA